MTCKSILNDIIYPINIRVLEYFCEFSLYDKCTIFFVHLLELELF